MFFYEIRDGKIKNCPPGQEYFPKFRLFNQEVFQVPRENDFLVGIYTWWDGNRTRYYVDGVEIKGHDNVLTEMHYEDKKVVGDEHHLADATGLIPYKRQFQDELDKKQNILTPGIGISKDRFYNDSTIEVEQLVDEDREVLDLEDLHQGLSTKQDDLGLKGIDEKSFYIDDKGILHYIIGDDYQYFEGEAIRIVPYDEYYDRVNLKTDDQNIFTGLLDTVVIDAGYIHEGWNTFDLGNFRPDQIKAIHHVYKQYDEYDWNSVEFQIEDFRLTTGGYYEPRAAIELKVNNVKTHYNGCGIAHYPVYVVVVRDINWEHPDWEVVESEVRHSFVTVVPKSFAHNDVESDVHSRNALDIEQLEDDEFNSKKLNLKIKPAPVNGYKLYCPNCYSTFLLDENDPSIPDGFNWEQHLYDEVPFVKCYGNTYTYCNGVPCVYYEKIEDATLEERSKFNNLYYNEDLDALALLIQNKNYSWPVWRPVDTDPSTEANGGECKFDGTTIKLWGGPHVISPAEYRNNFIYIDRSKDVPVYSIDFTHTEYDSSNAPNSVSFNNEEYRVIDVNDFQDVFLNSDPQTYGNYRLRPYRSYFYNNARAFDAYWPYLHSAQSCIEIIPHIVDTEKDHVEGWSRAGYGEDHIEGNNQLIRDERYTYAVYVGSTLYPMSALHIEGNDNRTTCRWGNYGVGTPAFVATQTYAHIEGAENSTVDSVKLAHIEGLQNRFGIFEVDDEVDCSYMEGDQQVHIEGTNNEFDRIGHLQPSWSPSWQWGYVHGWTYDYEYGWCHQDWKYYTQTCIQLYGKDHNYYQENEIIPLHPLSEHIKQGCLVIGTGDGNKKVLDYNIEFMIEKDGQPILIVDSDGNLHLKAGAQVIYDS